MSTKTDIYAIITARGGSKGLHRKNLQPLAGIPLICHTIRAALDCKEINRCVVTTEDPEIKKISLKWGSEVIDRPIRLASDTSLSKDAVRHVLEVLHKKADIPKYFILLQPTSPIRTASHISACINALFQSNAKSAISVTEAEHHPAKMFFYKNNVLSPVFSEEQLESPRQLLPIAYRQNGAIYLTPRDLFLRKNSFFIQPIMPFFMKKEESIDIDSAEDLVLCEQLLKT